MSQFTLPGGGGSVIDILLLHKVRRFLCEAEISCIYLYRCSVVHAHVRASGPDLVRIGTVTTGVTVQGYLGSYAFEERRISILSVYCEFEVQSPGYCLPPFYSVVILTDLPTNTGPLRELEAAPGLQGFNTFYSALYKCIDGWQRVWNDVLDIIDECMSVRLQDTLDPKQVKDWMFDDNFERSKRYVIILQTLRIFAERIRTTSDDIGFIDIASEDADVYGLLRKRSHDERRAMVSNWEVVKKFHKQAEGSLLHRISRKTEEVKSFRDGV